MIQLKARGKKSTTPDLQASPAVRPAVDDDAVAAVSPDVFARRRVRLALAMAVLVMLVGGAAAIGSRSLGYWTALGPGPGFFPLCLGVLLIVFGGAWLVEQLRGRGAAVIPGSDGVGDTAPTGSTSAGDPVPVGGVEEGEAPEYSLPTVIAILVSLCVLAATLEILGYQLAMFLFLMFHLLVLGRRRLLLSVAISLAGSIGVFVVFTRLLGVPLPASSVPFLAGLGF